MNKLYSTISIFFLCAFHAYSQSEYLNIENQLSFGSSLIDIAEKTAIDHDGNVLVAGIFSQEADFDPSEDDFVLEPLGSPDIFLSSYDASNNLNWAINIGRIGLDNGVTLGGLAVDSEGNIIIAGGFSLTVDFDPSEVTNALTAVQGRDAFVAKYSSSGNLIWLRQFGSTALDDCTALSVDQNDNIVLGVRYSAEIDLDPGDINDVLVNPIGQTDASIVQLDSSGNLNWVYTVAPDLEDEIVSSLATTQDGTVIIGATVSGSNVGIPEQSMFAAVVNPDGTELWKYDFMNLGQVNTISHIGVSQDGESFYLGGRIQSNTDFDPSGNTLIIDPNFADAFISKHTLANGALEWATYVSSNSLEDYCAGVHESNGLTFMLGSFDDQATFNPSDFSTMAVANGASDIFATVYDSETGEFIEFQTYGGEGVERAHDASFAESNGLSLVGQFSSSLELIDGESTVSSGFSDAFMARFSYLYNLSSSGNLRSDEITIYPVPTKDYVWVNLENGFSSPVRIRLISIIGQTVLENMFDRSMALIKLDLSALGNGLYLAEVSVGNSSVTKRIIKK